MSAPPEPGDADYVTITALEAAEVDEPCADDVPVDMNVTAVSSRLDEPSRLRAG